LGLMVLMAVGAVAVALVIRTRTHAMQMEKAALLFGAKQPQQPQRRPRVGTGDNGPAVIVVNGQGAGRMEDFRDGYR